MRRLAADYGGAHAGRPFSVETLDLFSWSYGVETGDPALGLMATVGVYRGTNAPEFVGTLRDRAFMMAVSNRGRVPALSEPIRLRNIVPGTGLSRAARHLALLEVPLAA